jgi:hypothetical protein
MRTRTKLVTGIVAASLVLTAGGIAIGTSGGTRGAQATSVSAQHPRAATMFTDMKDLAQLKRIIARNAVEAAWARQAHAGTSQFTDQGTSPS